MAKKKYFSVLIAVLLAGIITKLLSLILFVGWLISIIVGVVLLFIVQSVVIGNKNATESLSESYHIFRKNILSVFLFWILAVIIVFTLLILAIVPVAIAAMPVIMAFASSGGNMMSVIPLMQQNMNGIIEGGIIGCAILAYAEAFYQAALSFFYISAKRK